MSESKLGGFPRRYPDRNGEDTGRFDSDGGFGNRQAGGRLASEAQGNGNGMEAYKRWLTRVQAPGSRRIPLDASLYTWKGYRNWSDKVRRDWKPTD